MFKMKKLVKKNVISFVFKVSRFPNLTLWILNTKRLSNVLSPDILAISAYVKSQKQPDVNHISRNLYKMSDSGQIRYLNVIEEVYKKNNKSTSEGVSIGLLLFRAEWLQLKGYSKEASNIYLSCIGGVRSNFKDLYDRVFEALTKSMLDSWEYRKVIELCENEERMSNKTKCVYAEALIDSGDFQLAKNKLFEVFDSSILHPKAVMLLSRIDKAIPDKYLLAAYKEKIEGLSVKKNSYMAAARVYHELMDFKKSKHYAHLYLNAFARDAPKKYGSLMLLGQIAQAEGCYSEALTYLSWAENIAKTEVKKRQKFGFSHLKKAQRSKCDVLIRMGDYKNAKNTPRHSLGKDQILYHILLSEKKFKSAWRENFKRKETLELSWAYPDKYLGSDVSKSDLINKKVFVLGEGGIGDQVRFIPAIKDLYERCQPDRVSLSCDPRLVDIVNDGGLKFQVQRY